MTFAVPTTPMDAHQNQESCGPPKPRGLPFIPSWEPGDNGAKLWSLCAPGTVLPGCHESDCAAMPILVRAIQIIDPRVDQLSQLSAQHLLSAHAAIRRLGSSPEVGRAIGRLSDALFEMLVDHDSSPYTFETP